MKKRFLVVPVLICTIFNCSISAFASTKSTTISTMLSSNEIKNPYKEPSVGEISYKEDMSSSYYVWRKVIVTCSFNNNEWKIKTEIKGDTLIGMEQVRPYLTVQYLKFDLPKNGVEGQEIQKTFWIYIGEGLKTEVVVKKLQELEYNMMEINGKITTNRIENLIRSEE